MTAADFDTMIAVNLRAPFLLAQRILAGHLGATGAVRPASSFVVGP